MDSPMDYDNIFARDDKFWENYGRGRPRPPPTFFSRIFDYHKSKGGKFGTVHDVGAGNGPYARQLRAHFEHVILSDIVPENVNLAQQRLVDIENFTFRAAKLEDAKDIEQGSVDMVFATNVMHFPDPQESGVAAIAYQLRTGGTVAIAAFGPARFDNARLQDLWSRISQEGGRQLLKAADDPTATIRLMARTQDTYNVAPLSEQLFEEGVCRVYLNMSRGGIQSVLPPEEHYRNIEPSYTGANDRILHQDEAGWDFEMDTASVREHINSFPFVSQFPEALQSLTDELDQLLAEVGPVRGSFPAAIILATRL